MAVTEEQVKQAEADAEAAEARADAAQKTADSSRDTAKASDDAAQQARDDADAADEHASKMEKDAAISRGEANAANDACRRAQDDAARAQSRLQRAQSNQAAVHAQYPNECNSETDAADTDVEIAQSEVQAANASRDSVCATAKEKENAAKESESAAAKARKEANDADARADTAKEKAENDAETARSDQATAQQAVVNAANANSAARQARVEFEAQQATPPQAPQQPDHGDAAGHTGQPKPPTHGEGTTGSSLFDFNITALTHSWKLSAAKWEKAPIFMEITQGYKHRFTLGIQYLLVAGARGEEVGGLDTKVTLAGDWRQIASKRLERNAGIKVESVLGDVDETVFAGEVRQTPVIRQDKNPSTYSGKGPTFESTAGKALNDFKSKAYDKYLSVRLQANAAKFHSTHALISAAVWNQMIGQINEEMDTHDAQFTKLEQACKNFQIKSSSFVKMLANGAMKLKAGKFTGKVKSKVKCMASALAEFKGAVNLAG